MSFQIYQIIFGLTTIEQPDGQKVIQYFDSDGIQLKGNAAKDNDGNLRYFDGNTGDMVINSFGELPDGSWLYLNDKGISVTGEQEINGQTYYFDADGKQVKNDFRELPDGSWLYLNDKGIAVTGKQEINGQTYYFNADGKQVKNDFKELPDGSWLYLNDKGIAVTGKQEINGQTYYFNADGKQVKGNIVRESNGKTNYYEGKNGTMLKNDFGKLPNGSWVYLKKLFSIFDFDQII